VSNLTVAAWRSWKGAPTEPPDPVVQAAIDAAELAIGDDLQRQVVVAGAVATARVYAATRRDILRIHDCTTVTVVSNDGTTVDAADYQLEPIGPTLAGQLRPYTQIRALNGTGWVVDGGRATCTVTGTWGWLALPANYTEAVKIVTSDILDQKDIRGGVAGFGEFGAVSVRENAMVVKLLSKLRRAESWVVA